MPTNNSCSVLAGSVEWCEGKTVVPGIRRRCYYIHKKSITKWPVLAGAADGRPTTSTYQGSFELAEGEHFHHVDLLINGSGINSDPQGEMPSQTQLNKFVGVHPGTKEEATMLAAYCNNSDLVWLTQDADGKFRVTGSEMSETKTTVSQAGGQNRTDTAQTTVNVEATDLIPQPFYTGQIDDEDSMINPEESGEQSGKTGD